MSLLVLGCGGATNPTLPATSYDLVTYEGLALPAETRVLVDASTTPGGPTVTCSDRLTGMHLQFSGGGIGTYTQSESRLLVCDDGRPDVPSSGVINGNYEYKGLLLLLTADLGGGFSQRNFGQFTGTGLTVYHEEVMQNGANVTSRDSQLVFVATP